MPTKDPNQGNIELEEDGPPEAVGHIRLDGGSIKAQDSIGVFNLRQGAAAANDLCFAVFKTDGGLVYDSAGSPVLKEVA